MAAASAAVEALSSSHMEATEAAAVQKEERGGGLLKVATETISCRSSAT